MEFHCAGMTPTDWRHKLLVPPKTEKIRQTKKANVMPLPPFKAIGYFHNERLYCVELLWLELNKYNRNTNHCLASFASYQSYLTANIPRKLSWMILCVQMTISAWEQGKIRGVDKKWEIESTGVKEAAHSEDKVQKAKRSCPPKNPSGFSPFPGQHLENLLLHGIKAQSSVLSKSGECRDWHTK